MNEKITNQIAEMKNYNGYLLMKITSKYRYQQRFLDGKLFFNIKLAIGMTDIVGMRER